MAGIKGNTPKYLKENRTEFIELEKFAIWYAKNNNKPVPVDMSLWLDNEDIIEFLSNEMLKENQRRQELRNKVAKHRNLILQEKERKDPNLKKERLKKGWHSSESQSISGTLGGNKNKETGWWDTFIEMGRRVSHAPASCKYCGLDSIRLAITKEHDENCNQKPEVIMPILNALPNEFTYGMIKPYFDQLSIEETLQATIENTKWFKPIAKFKTYNIYQRGENYLKYIKDYPDTTLCKTTHTVESYFDEQNKMLKKKSSDNVKINIVKLYNSLPNEFFLLKEAEDLTKKLDLPKITANKLVNNASIIEIISKEGQFNVYFKKLGPMINIDLIKGVPRKTARDLRLAYSSAVENTYKNFILSNGNIDANKMYQYFLDNMDPKEIGPIKGKQKLTKQLQSMGLECEFIDYKLHNKIVNILDAIPVDEFTSKHFKDALNKTGLKLSRRLLLEDENYCVKIHEGVLGSKTNIPIYKKTWKQTT